MIEPMNVRPQRFTPERLLYDNGDYSVVWGRWDNRMDVIGQRWNGEPGPSVGFPSQGGHPTWMILDERLTLPFLYALLGATDLHGDMVHEIRRTIEEVRNR